MLEEIGCFAIVLEKIPAQLAKRVADSVTIPVIGIGAGADVDGQVLYCMICWASLPNLVLAS